MSFVETPSGGYKVDGRVSIALDALDESQRDAVSRVLADRKRFIASTAVLGKVRRLPRKSRIYSLKGPDGLRIIYSKTGDDITVMDLIQHQTLLHYGSGGGFHPRRAGVRKPRRPRVAKGPK